MQKLLILVILGCVGSGALIFAQTQNQQNTSPTGTGTTSTSPGSSQPSGSRTQANDANTVTQPQRPIFVTGNVLMSNGNEPPEPVAIERVCSVNTARPEGFTDSQGRFSLMLGLGQTSVADASNGPQDTISQQSRARDKDAANSGGIMSDSTLWGCELRARLPGYRSSTVSLSNRRAMDEPGVGTIILYGAAEATGLTISMTDAQAPKEARKGYEKGLASAKKDKPAQAEKEFRQAVELFPRYASAWLELGNSLTAQSKSAEAREAYKKAIEADGKFVPPYEGLYRLAFQEENLQELLANTDQVIRLNPIEFPDAYFFNAVAHYELKNFAKAEASVRRSIEMRGKRADPKAYYLLGLILIQTKEMTEAAEYLRAFVRTAPTDPQVKKALSLIGQIEELASR